jgi:hypothetical protein
MKLNVKHRLDPHTSAVDNRTLPLPQRRGPSHGRTACQVAAPRRRAAPATRAKRRQTPLVLRRLRFDKRQVKVFLAPEAHPGRGNAVQPAAGSRSVRRTRRHSGYPCFASAWPHRFLQYRCSRCSRIDCAGRAEWSDCSTRPARPNRPGPRISAPKCSLPTPLFFLILCPRSISSRYSSLTIPNHVRRSYRRFGLFAAIRTLGCNAHFWQYS